MKAGFILSERRTSPASADLPARVEASDFASEKVADSDSTPRISKPLLTWFTWYSRRYLRRHFHSLRVTGAKLSEEQASCPLVVYSNHASWWDPLVGLLVSRELFPARSLFAPMDAAALRRYGFFRRLGVFGVELGTRRGATTFLRQTRAILGSSSNALWLTPQGRFADARERPVEIKAGIGHLPGLAGEIQFLPIAIEYVFWEERLPEILVRIGEPHYARRGESRVNAAAWVELFADRLRVTQDELARQAQRRQPGEFRCLLQGRAGVGGIYDRWRKFRSGLKRETFQLEHGRL